MRRTQQVILAGSLASAMGIGLAGVEIAVAEAPPISASAAFAVTDDTLSTDLTYGRDEERMAGILYLLFGRTYGAAIFDRIAASEQQHFDAVGALLTGSAIADPAAGQPAGNLHRPRCAGTVRPVEGGGPDFTRGRVRGGGRTGADRYRRPGEDHRAADRRRRTTGAAPPADCLPASPGGLHRSGHGGTAGAPSDGSQTGVRSDMRDGHGMGDGAGMGRMGRSDS